jgi:Flp pilus assembly pilin Flp
MKQYLVRLWENESGQDTAEYALLLLLIALALVLAITSYSSAIANVFSRTGEKLAGTAAK